MIEQNSFGYNENEKEKNWAYEKARRELNKHKEQKPIDHPDGSVTTEKLADNSVTEPKLANGSVSKKKLSGEVREELTGLGQKIREAYDKAVAALGLGEQLEILQQNINTEALARQTADTALQQNINSEVAARQEADNALSERAAALEGKAHTHPNAEVLDGITAADVEKWDGIKEQVTQEQLDAAIAYFEEIGFSLSAQFAMLMTALGVVVYDGGWFGEEQDGVSLDGGAFEDENLDLFDCGGFEPLSIGITTNAVTDGGTY